MNDNDKIFEELTNELSQMKKAGEILTEQKEQAQKLTESVESLVTGAGKLQESLQSLQEEIAAEHKSAVDSLRTTSQEIHQAVERFFNQQLQRYQEQLAPLLEEYQRVINEYRSIDIAAHFQQQLHALAGIKSELLQAFKQELQQYQQLYEDLQASLTTTLTHIDATTKQLSQLTTELPQSISQLLQQSQQTLSEKLDAFQTHAGENLRASLEHSLSEHLKFIRTDLQQLYDQQQRSLQNIVDQFYQNQRRYEDFWDGLSSTLQGVDSHTKHLSEIAAPIPQVISDSVQEFEHHLSQLLETATAHAKDLEKFLTEQFQSIRTALQQQDILSAIEVILSTPHSQINEILQLLQATAPTIGQTLPQLSEATATLTRKSDGMLEQFHTLFAHFNMRERAAEDTFSEIAQAINNHSQQLTRQHEQLVAITASLNAIGQNQSQREQAFASQVNMLITHLDKISSDQQKELRSTLIVTTIVALLLALLLAVTIVR